MSKKQKIIKNFSKILIFLLTFFITTFSFALPFYAKEPRTVNIGTFYEYTYKIVKDSLDFEEKFIVNGEIDKNIANRMYENAKKARLYLKDNLENDRLLKYFKISIQRGILEPTNKNAYKDIMKRMKDFLEKADVYRIRGKIVANPIQGNAPLTVTLQAFLEDESGAKVNKSDIMWYIIEGSKKRKIGNGTLVKYTINSEGKIPIFLEVKSNHRNSKGYRDVLPLVLSKEITIFKKSVNLSLSINGNNTKYKDTLKFTPEEAAYGLIFDPSGTYTSNGSSIISTKWDFGNGETKAYEGKPRVERMAYGKAGSYKVKLEVKTNDNRIVKKEIILYIHKPIAVIASKSEKGFIGDSFTFVAKKNSGIKGAKYDWIIKDIDKDEELAKGEGATFSYTFLTKGRKKIILNVTDLANRKDSDTKDITILSRPPKASFRFLIKEQNKPNRVYLDASNSYDPDFGDEKSLEYIWSVDGKNISLENANQNSSIGYYTFNSIGEHKIKLEVRDSDGMSSEKIQTINIKSLLQVEMKVSPEVAPAEYLIKFRAKSKNARIYKWNFGDGNEKSGTNSIATHRYLKSGNYKVKLTVEDNSGDTNTVSKTIYIGEKGKPKAVIDIKKGGNKIPVIEKNICEGNDAYIVNRKDSFNFSAARSINIDGRNHNLDYSWKIGKDNISGFNITSQNFSRKFKTLGCVPITLSVISKDNHKVNKAKIWVKVKNLPPVLKGIAISQDKRYDDPLMLNLRAIGAKDPDGAIQSYLWYYYTEDDPEPQGYKITMVPNTIFTIPKNNGKYYFVVVLKDSNGLKVSSKDITGEEYVFEVVNDNDNVNTPIISFRVSDNNVSVGEKVQFTAFARNIVGQDITKKSIFAWDFDGDGIYDKKTNQTNKVVHFYKKSGSFLAKVKVTYNGVTNTRTLKIDVSNPLEPDFDYFSIGNKVVFVDESIGKVERVDWELGDKTKVKNSFYSIHYYPDSNKTYKATIKVSEGNKLKEKTKEIKINKTNKFYYRKKGLHIIAFPKLKDGEIYLDKKGKKVYLYLGESRVLGKDFKKFAIDYDIEEDSDADSITDNDIDNMNDLSYERGTPVEIKLNNQREQVVKISLIGDDPNEIFEQKTIKIVKTYIDENSKILERLDTINLEKLSPEEKDKIKEIKGYIKTLPEKYWLESIKKLEGLMDSWDDSREKVISINDFKDYLGTVTDKNGNKVEESEKIISILDGFLSENVSNISDERQGKYELILKALEGKNIENFDKIKSNLIYIRDNEADTEGNRTRAKEIWEEVKKAAKEGKIAEDDAKNIFVILKTFAGLDNVKEKVETKTEQTKSSSFSFGSLFGSGLLITLLYIFGGIIGFIVLLLLLFLIGYLFSSRRKKDKISFSDYIIEKTRGRKKVEDEVVEDDVDDIFGDLDENSGEDNITNTFENKEDNNITSRDPLALSDNLVEEKQEKKEDVPDWLLGGETKKEEEKKSPDFLGGEQKIQEVKKEEEIKEEKIEEPKKEEEGDVPDWLKGVDLEGEKTKDTDKEIETENIVSEEEKKEEIPDFLGLNEEKKENKKEEKIKEEKIEEPKKEENKREEKKQEKKSTKTRKKITKTKKVDKNLDFSDEELEKMTDIENGDIPDWLKDTVEKEQKKTRKKTTSKKTEEKKEEDLPDWLKEEAKKTTTKEKKSTNSTKKSKDTEELWDDGMDIPDWLQEEAKKKNK